MATSEDVLSALRLGWAIVEVRGRNQADPIRTDKLVLVQPSLGIEGQDPSAKKLATSEQSAPGKSGSFPLISSRPTWEERSAQALTIVDVMATNLGVNVKVPPSDSATYTQKMSENVDSWDVLSKLIFDFDKKIETSLASSPPEISEAYQLGRGLAETRWSLCSDMDTNLGGTWSTVLSKARCNYLAEMLGRLSGHFTYPLTAPVVAGSLVAWRLAASVQPLCPPVPSKFGPSDAQARTAALAIDHQVQRWYDLVIAGRDPSTLVSPHALLKDWRLSWRAAGQFTWQLLGLGLGIVLLVVVGVLISLDKSNAGIRTVLGLIAGLGITASTLTATVKNRTQALVSRFRADVATDLATIETTTLPTFPPTLDRTLRVNEEDPATHTVDSIPIRTPAQFIRDAAKHRSTNGPVLPLG